MMSENDMLEIKAKNKELMTKASIYTNLAYALVEAASSIILDVSSILKKLDADIDRNEKAKYKNVCRTGKQFKIWLDDLAKVVYKIENADTALEDSDKLYDLLLLIMDRCGGDDNILTQIRAMVFNNFKSKYKYYK